MLIQFLTAKKDEMRERRLELRAWVAISVFDRESGELGELGEFFLARAFTSHYSKFTIFRLGVPIHF